jgi:hypothetical protein
MDSRPLIQGIVTAMIDYDIDEQHTVGELLHAIRVGTGRMSRYRAVVWDDPNGPPQTISLTDLDDLPEATDAT